MFAKLLREPLLHFLLLGAGLFLLFGWARGNGERSRDEIVINAAGIEQLKTTFARTWQRQPTREELEGLIADRIREEVYYREATALGLDRDDIVVRRRMRQKMEFLAGDLADRLDPTDDELRTYIGQSPASYRTPDRFTFHQVYLDPERHGERLKPEAARLLILLNDGGADVDAGKLGDRLMLPNEMDRASKGDVARVFGDQFAERLESLEIGRWQGPIPSGYGLHLVLLKDRIAGRIPSLDQVRDQVERDWRRERKKEANEKLFRDLASRYAVRVEAPESSVSGPIARGIP